MHDLRFAIRSLLRSPGFALAAILTLAIAIGANTAMFSILYRVVLEPLPFRDPSRLVMVWESDVHNASLREGASMPDYRDWLAQQRVFDGLAGTTNLSLNLTDPNADAERIAVNGVSHNYFSLLGGKPLAGRGFVAADDRPGAEPVVILSDALWHRRFNGSPAVIEKTITLDGKGHRVVGVMPESLSISRRTRPTELWLPLTTALAPFNDVRGMHNVYTVGRLREGVTRAEAQSQMEVIAKRLEKQYAKDNEGRGVFVEPLIDAIVRESRRRLWVLSGAVVLVLLIACINVAGLMLARSDARSRELAVRASLGASRSRLVRQLLTESMVIGVVGGVAGVTLAWWLTRTMLALAPTLPRSEGIAMNVPALLFALGISLASAVLFGLIPAMRGSTMKPALALTGARGVLRGTRTAGRGVLVVVEVALAVVLAIGAGLLLKSLSHLLSVDVGLETERVMAASFKLPESKYPSPKREEYPRWPEVTAFYDALYESMQNAPGVHRFALALNHPLATGWTSQFGVTGRPAPEGPKDEVRIRAAGPGYFETLGIPVLRGRTIQAADRGETPLVVVVNEALVKKYFPNEDPLGKQVEFWGIPRTIVGVVRGERFGGPQAAPEPSLYPPLAQLPMSEITLIVRARGEAESVTGTIRQTLRTLDPDIALYDVETLDESLGRTVATPRFQAILVASFGAIALLLAAIGLYGLIAYQVQQRLSEIGVRLALGATRADIVRLVLVRAGVLSLTGVGLGLLGALAVTRVVSSLLFNVSATDPAIYATVAIVLTLIALIASWVPTLRAVRVQPAVALRYE